MKKLAILLITIYQKFLSPMLGKRCRFYPSCSCYSKQAFQKYGFFKGFFLTILRLSKCHPFHSGGYDPLK